MANLNGIDLLGRVEIIAPMAESKNDRPAIVICAGFYCHLEDCCKTWVIGLPEAKV